MVTVAERFRRKIVVLVHMGSNPICHTLTWGYSSVAEQRTVNPFVESSTLSIPAMSFCNNCRDFVKGKPRLTFAKENRNAQVAKWQTRRSAKPVSAGPIPALSSTVTVLAQWREHQFSKLAVVGSNPTDGADIAGWCSWLTYRPHKPKPAGSSPAPETD